MVTRKDIVVRDDQLERQGQSAIARRSPHEASLEFDPEQFQRSFPPLSDVNQPQATFVQNIIINGDYHYKDEAAGAWAALTDKKSAKRQRQLQLDNERRDREDRKERFERRDSFMHLFGFLSYIVVMVVIAAMIFALGAMGMIRH